MTLPLNQVLFGNCGEVLRNLPSDSVHAVVTDPPYGLGQLQSLEGLVRAWLDDEDDTPYTNKRGFMNAAWDVIPSPKVWREIFRVLKPGGYAVVFAGTATWDLMSLSLRLAGFTCRNTIAHHYGAVSAFSWSYSNGFPKGTDISKMIDRMKGMTREVVGQGKGRTGPAAQPQGGSVFSDDNYQWPGTYDKTEPMSDEAKAYRGFNTQLKPAWEPILLFQKPITEKTIARQVLATGTGALHVDACRVEGTSWGERPPRTPNAIYGQGKGTDVGEGSLAQSHGRYPPNLVLSHSLFCTSEEGCHESCPIAALDQQSGKTQSRSNRRHTHYGTQGYGSNSADFETGGYDDQGGASRYFPQFHPLDELNAPFMHTPKASTRERSEGCEDLQRQVATVGESRPSGDFTQRMHPELDYEPQPRANIHPTVKPLSLMSWLCRLVCVEGGTILDPFAGSGTTLRAGVEQGYSVIGIEGNAEYLPIARARLSYGLSKAS